MYTDTVIDKKLVHQPKFLCIFFGVVFMILFALNLGNSIFGQFLAPVIGDPTTSGLYGRFGVIFSAVVLAPAYGCGLLLLLDRLSG